MLRSLSLAVLLAACGGGAPATTTTPRETPPATASADPTCPVAVAGTSVTVEDTATGAAFVFVTTSDVAELRKRVAGVATDHNARHGAMGALPDGTDAGGGGHDHHTMDHSAHGAGGADHAGHAGHAGHAASGGGGLAAMIGVHSKAVATDIDGGARLELVAFAPDVGKLQGELRMHAQHLSSGSCAMDHH